MRSDAMQCYKIAIRYDCAKMRCGLESLGGNLRDGASERADGCGRSHLGARMSGMAAERGTRAAKSYIGD